MCILNALVSTLVTSVFELLVGVHQSALCASLIHQKFKGRLADVGSVLFIPSSF